MKIVARSGKIAVVTDSELKDHHKLCLDEGLTLGIYSERDFQIVKTLEEEYTLFEVKEELFDMMPEWVRVAKSKDFLNFKLKVQEFFRGVENETV
ncbi:MAG: hypothetical protein RR191_05490 [Cetobacterium sp.]|uniref:hypothetical protein n=1 Tax=Cetobacterium sp. TaxID=2071632 RepID=UPI002FC7ABD4